MKVFGKKLKNKIYDLKDDIKFCLKLSALGSVGSFLAYLATKVEEHELSLVGKLVDPPPQFFDGLPYNDPPARIITITEALERIRFDYALLATFLGFTGYGLYHVIKNRYKSSRGGSE